MSRILVILDGNTTYIFLLTIFPRIRTSCFDGAILILNIRLHSGMLTCAEFYQTSADY